MRTIINRFVSHCFILNSFFKKETSPGWCLEPCGFSPKVLELALPTGFFLTTQDLLSEQRPQRVEQPSAKLPPCHHLHTSDRRPFKLKFPCSFLRKSRLVSPSSLGHHPVKWSVPCPPKSAPPQDSSMPLSSPIQNQHGVSYPLNLPDLHLFASCISAANTLD